MRFGILALFLAAAACSDDDPGSTAGDGGAGATGSSTSATTTSSSSGGDGGGGGAPTCPVNTIELIVSSQGGVPDRFHAHVRFQGQDAALLFDTGSALTFLFIDDPDPVWEPDYGTIELGCDTVPVPGRGGLADHGEVDGLPVIGILGVDYVAAGTSLIDHDADQIVRHPSGTVLPETAGWSELPFDDVEGHMIAPVELDGEPLRLMFDTGAPHILWLGEQGQPGDQEVQTSDAKGNILTLYYGDVLLEMAGEPEKTVPVLRAPSFPYFEMTVASLGGNIHGLLGLSALDGRRFVIDGATDSILIEPR